MFLEAAALHFVPIRFLAQPDTHSELAVSCSNVNCVLLLARRFKIHLIRLSFTPEFFQGQSHS